MARKRKPQKRLHKGYMLGDLRLDDPPARDVTTNDSGSKEIALSERKPFRLRSLPDELVLRVLEFAVIQSTKMDPIHINSAVQLDRELSAEDLRHGALSGRPYKKRKWALVQPAIARTCHFLRIEGTKIFYKQNYFFTDSSTDGIYGLSKWLRCLEPTMIPTIYVQWIQHIEHFDLDYELTLGELRWKHFLHEIDWLLEHEEFKTLPFDVYFKRKNDGSGIPAMNQGFPTLEWSPTRMSRTQDSPCYEIGLEIEGSPRRNPELWLYAGDAKTEERDEEEMFWPVELDEDQ